MLTGLLGFWLLGLPVSLYLGFGRGYGPVGLWWGLVLGLVSVAIVLVMRLQHRLGLLALRSAMRLTVLGTPPEPITLRHGRDELRVSVHALPDAVDGTPRVLLSLRPALPQPADSAARHPWSTHA